MVRSWYLFKKAADPAKRGLAAVLRAALKSRGERKGRRMHIIKSLEGVT